MTLYKVVATVHKVSRPAPVAPGEHTHVLLPCRLYKEGDKIVFEDNQINMAETTGALCLSLIASMIPVLKALQRSVEPLMDEETGEPLPDSTQKVTWFSCPDAERPIIFKIERIPLKRKPGWVIAEEIARRNPGMRIHLHLPNPNDRLRGVQDNLWEEIVEPKIREGAST